MLLSDWIRLQLYIETKKTNFEFENLQVVAHSFESKYLHLTGLVRLNWKINSIGPLAI
jgi:hypothetical protein